MTNEECGTAPPALDGLPMDPALPGWADFWCRPSGPGLQTPLSHVHSCLDLPQASHPLGMTKGVVVLPFGIGSQVSKVRPRGKPGQAGAPFSFTPRPHPPCLPSSP